MGDPAKLAIKDTDVEDLGYCVALMGHFKKYGDMMRSFLALAWHLGAKDIGNDLRSDWKDTNFNETCGKPATPAKKEDKKPADTKKDDTKKPADKKDDTKKPAADTKKPAADTKKPAADTKKDDTKKPAADAKKDDTKKPAAPADTTKKRILQQKVNKDADKKADDGKKPEEKKPANPDDWPLDKKTGKKDDESNWKSANESWATYIYMEQKNLPIEKPKSTTECLGEAWNKFMNPIIFGKGDTKFPGLPDFDFFFKALVYLNANVAGPKSMDVYKAMMGKSWGSQVTAKAKTKAKLKINVKSAGNSIAKAGKAVGDWFNKAGKSVANGVKSAAKGVADSVNKAAAGLKGKVKLNVKAAPKAKVSLKAGAKAAPKAKVSLKAGA